MKADNINLDFDIVVHIKEFFKNISSSIRGTVIGFCAGFTPGVSTAVSANLAYAIEKWWNRKTYKLGDYRSLVSAETANNAGAFSCLLPLMVFGIPLVPSEALLYELASVKGLILGQEFDATWFFTNLTPVLFITNFVAVFLAWPLAKYVCYLHKIPSVVFRAIVFLLLITSIYFSGISSFSEWYYLTVFVCLMPVGYALRNYDTLPLVFVFVIQSRLDVIAISLGDLLK